MDLDLWTDLSLNYTGAGVAPFVIATHSPMLLTIPGATVLSLDGGAIRRVAYEDTDQPRAFFLPAPVSLPVIRLPRKPATTRSPCSA